MFAALRRRARRRGTIIRARRAARSSFAQTGLSRVGMTGERGKGAIELLEKHNASELVRQGQRGKGKMAVRKPSEAIRDAFGGTAEENQLAHAAVAQPGEPAGEVFGGEPAAFGRPEDVARAVRFFLEPDHYLTGQVLLVDGGLTLRR